MARAEAAFISRRHRKYKVIGLFCSLFLLGSNAAGAAADALSSCASLRSMARVYMASGRYEKAQPFLEKALHIAEATNALDSEACACMLDLAFLYKNQGRLAAAEVMCQSGLVLQQRIYHKNHPYVAHTLRILSEIYRRQARYQEAASVLERAITIIRDVSRGDDLELAPFKVDMARLLVAKGDLDHAEALFKEAIEIIEPSYGPEHLYTAKVLASMADLYVQQERYAEAERLISRALPIEERIYGKNHYHLVPVWLTASRIYLAKGDSANAKKFLDKSLDIVENHAGADYLIEGDVWGRLGELCVLNGRYDQAEVVLKKALIILENAKEAQSDPRATVLNNLAKVYAVQGKYSKAESLSQRALIIEKVVVTP